LLLVRDQATLGARDRQEESGEWFAKNWAFGNARPMAPNPGTHVRLPAELLARIDRWRRDHPDFLTRPEAMRELIEVALNALEQRKRPTKK
jgi:hypothetical protein